MRQQFAEDVRDDVWVLLPLTDHVLWRVSLLSSQLPKNVPLRAGDAIHIASALVGGFHELWTSDRHLLAAATHFGLRGRSV
jgi:predicted nucleic acid-binding protein